MSQISGHFRLIGTISGYLKQVAQQILQVGAEVRRKANLKTENDTA